MIKSEISQWVFNEKYRFENESESEFADRIGKALGKSNEEILLFSNLIQNHKFMPAGRSLYGLGTGKKSICYSNCFVIPIRKDSMDSIMEAATNAAMTFKWGGGVGYNFSILRPNKAKTFKSDGKSTGVVSFMQIFNSVCETIMTGGNRRGAGVAVLDVWHVDIEEFIVAKRNGGLTSFNISVGISDAFMKAVESNEKWDLMFPETTHKKYDSEWDGNIEQWIEKGYPVKIYKTVNAKDLYDSIIKSNYNFAEPGVLFLDTINKMNNLYYCETIQSTNPCFAEYSYITTRNGLFKIKDLVGKSVDIYNGEQWETIDNFQITGINQELMRVWLYDGSYLDVTPYHKFILEDGTKLETKDLNIGNRLKYENGLIITDGIKADGTYIKGFMLADGCIKENTHPMLTVYEPKFCCMDRLKESASELEIGEINTNVITELGFKLDSLNNRYIMQGLIPREYNKFYKWGSDEYKSNIPEEVFQWNLKSKCDFIAGVMDGDGSALDSKNGFSYQLSSIHYDFLVDFLRLLKSIGVFGKISLMKKAQYKEIKGDTYWTQDCWRLSIPQKYAIELSRRVTFSRLISFDTRNVIYNCKFNYNTIIDIEKLDGDNHTVYCCNIPSNHQILTGDGIITGNCGEICLSPFGACLLGSINLASLVKNPFENPIFDFESLETTASAGIVMLNRILDINTYPIKEQLHEATNKRLIGLGITGLGDALAMMKIKYSSQEGVDLTEKIIKKIRNTSYLSSIELAKTEGSFPDFDKEKFCSSKFVKTLPKDIQDKIKEFGIRNGRILTIPPTGTTSLLMNNVSSGLEPIFALEYHRTARADNGTMTKEFVVEDYAWKLYKELTGETNVHNAPPFFETALELTVDEHMKMQTILQKYIDNSISKTLNIPETYPYDDFSKVYWNAWKAGLKGCTTYRPNDVTGSILSTISEKDKTLKIVESEQSIINTIDSMDDMSKLTLFQELRNKYKLSLNEIDSTYHPYEKELLEVEPSRRHRVKLKNGAKIYITVTHDESGYPLEIFTTMPKEAGINGSGVFNPELYLEKKSHWDAITRLCSSLFRLGAPLEEIIKQLEKSSFFENDISGIIAAVLKCPHESDCEDFDEDDFFVPIYDTCPVCGKKTLVKHAQCAECTSCGYGKCSL